MKLWRRTTAIAVVSGMILFIVAATASAYHVVTVEDPPIWQPTDVTSMAINLGSGMPTWSLVMAGAMANPLTDPTLTVATGGSLGLTQIEFGAGSAMAGGQSISLGTDQTFMLYFYNGTDYYQDYTITPVGTNLVELCSSMADMMVTMEDISQVPIPPAALLLGSGLVGLIGLRRRLMGR